MTKVMVTGGAGFIGSVMVKQLLNEGFEAVCFDLSDQIARNSPPKETELYQGDILSLNHLITAIKGCDYVIHLAALLGVNRTETKRLECLRKLFLHRLRMFMGNKQRSLFAKKTR